MRRIAAELQKSQRDRQVTFSIAEGVVTQGDAELLSIVLENLLGNAWKFTNRRGSLHIECGTAPQADGRVAYSVRDNGAGFDTAHAGRLFRAFQRLHSDKEFDGIGIGLVTVQRVIGRHGGRVWAESVVDNGATFDFTNA